MKTNQRNTRGTTAKLGRAEAGRSDSYGTVRRKPGRLPKSTSYGTVHRKQGRPPKAESSAHKSGNDKLTASRVTNIISDLDNKRGSTVESISSKLNRIGQPINRGAIRHALSRAVKAGMLREIREERFSLPGDRKRRASSSNSASSAGTRRSRSNAAGVKISTIAHSKLKASSSAARSGSSADSRRRQRRPLQGRRTSASTETSSSVPDAEEAEDHEDDDAGVGDGDVDDQSSELTEKEGPGSSMSVANPVAGCDAVMVFGTR